MAKKNTKVESVEVPAETSAVAQLLASLQPVLAKQRQVANLKSAAYRFIEQKHAADEELQIIKDEQKAEADKLQAAVKEMGELHGFITSAIRERINHDPAVKQAKQALAKDNNAFVRFMTELQEAVASDARREEEVKQRPLLEIANLAKIHLDQLHQQFRITLDYKTEVARKAELCFKKADAVTGK